MSVYHIFIIKLVNYHITIAVFILMYAQASTTLAIVTLSLGDTAIAIDGTTVRIYSIFVPIKLCTPLWEVVYLK